MSYGYLKIGELDWPFLLACNHTCSSSSLTKISLADKALVWITQNYAATCDPIDRLAKGELPSGSSLIALTGLHMTAHQVSQHTCFRSVSGQVCHSKSIHPRLEDGPTTFRLDYVVPLVSKVVELLLLIVAERSNAHHLILVRIHG